MTAIYFDSRWPSSVSFVSIKSLLAQTGEAGHSSTHRECEPHNNLFNHAMIFSFNIEEVLKLIKYFSDEFLGRWKGIPDR